MQKFARLVETAESFSQKITFQTFTISPDHDFLSLQFNATYFFFRFVFFSMNAKRSELVQNFTWCGVEQAQRQSEREKKQLRPKDRRRMKAQT